MREFEIGPRKFKLNKLNPILQFHIVRRMTPILEQVIPVAVKLSQSKSASDEEQMKSLIPIINGISKLSDEDSEKVLFGLLSSAEMQQSHGNWAKVATQDRLLFEDLELPVLIQIAAQAFGYNLKGFLAASP